MSKSRQDPPAVLEVLMGREPPRQRAPKLRIHHFLLWMTLTAVLLGLGPMSADRWGLIYAVASILLGGLLTATAQLGFWRVRQRFAMEPGHWLLIAGTITLIARSLWLVFWTLAASSGLLPVVVFAKTYLLLPLIILVWGFIDLSGSPPGNGKWRIAIVVIALAQFAPWSAWAGYFVLSPSAAGVTLICACVDLLAGRQRDWLHWVGVISVFGNTGVYIACLTLWAYAA